MLCINLNKWITPGSLIYSENWTYHPKR